MTEVTTIFLEMNSAAELKPRRSLEAGFTIREVTERQWELNRSLYLSVGEAWKWIDKREWTPEQWRAYVDSDCLKTFVADFDGSIAGYYELARTENGDVEIAYFGLTPKFIGRGLGGALLTSAIEQAWLWDASRVWVHTCSLDHPSALQNYQARGMRIYERKTHSV